MFASWVWACPDKFMLRFFWWKLAPSYRKGMPFSRLGVSRGAGTIPLKREILWYTASRRQRTEPLFPIRQPIPMPTAKKLKIMYLFPFVPNMSFRFLLTAVSFLHPGYLLYSVYQNICFFFNSSTEQTFAAKIRNICSYF